ncbi:MAG: sugar phosphate nucleotidyltransferase [Desulfurispora sp.]|uniref:sugar phosphate nucleotidyltransferase n=1 Tax=Desulfurispora sp. TaxID=3014275 RepID=UPI00404937F8
MKALFLAGGMGTRLRPLTEHLPKPMVPVMSSPLLERNILKLKNFGIDEVILSTCYKSQHIEKHFGDGSRLGVKIHYLREEIPLGTGGAIKNAAPHITATTIVFNSDILCEIDFAAMLELHKQKRAVATIAATRVDNPTLYGVLEYDHHGYITSFKEKPAPHEITSPYINAGVYIIEPEMLVDIPTGRAVSVEKETYPTMLQKGYKIAIFPSGKYWLDIGTPEKYLQAHQDILQGRYRIGECDFTSERVYTGRGARIHPTARIIPPAYIGEEAELGAFSTIGPEAVIGRRAVIGAGCTIASSIIWDCTSVESGTRLFSTIVAGHHSISCYRDHSKPALDAAIPRPIAI